MKFVLPTKEHEQAAVEYIREFLEYGSSVSGSGNLDDIAKGGSYADWLANIDRERDIANPPEGRLPAFTYFYVREEDHKIVGTINIRLALNDFLRTEGGHIGYSVRPTERLKGYGTRMLREALAFCEVIGLSEVIVTCNRDNAASAGVIRNNGGVMEAEFYSDTFRAVIQRYRIITGRKHG